jgi:glutamate 5-kinase
VAEPIVVVKVGSSSVTTDDGEPDARQLEALCEQIAAIRARRFKVVVVSSGAIATGLKVLGAAQRPSEMARLQAAAAVGQPLVVRAWQDALSRHHLVAGQVLLDPGDLFSRRQYLLARATLGALLDQGAIPVVNENDAVADQEIRFGDNDRLAAVVAVLVGASRLVLLTDTRGVFTADPARFADATLIDEVTEIDHELELAAATTHGTAGTGGMASKLAAARLATWSGIEVVVADARAERIVELAAEGVTAGATVFRPRPRHLPARKAWIAFATASCGRVHVDVGARDALGSGASLLLAGVHGHDGEFATGDAIEVACVGELVAKGLARIPASEVRSLRASGSAPRDVVVVHRDDLVVLR